MNPAPLLFLATFFALATSWLGFVLVPQLQLGNAQQVEAKDTGALYPSRPAGMAHQGAEVYRANGCFYCHTEMVRPKGYGGDFDRGWGGRKSPVQSVAQDYLYADPVMLGSQRVGPDLTNIGLRQTNSTWFYQHLYNPQTVASGSTMPPYPYLFQKVPLKSGQSPDPDAVFPPEGAPKGYQIVPTAEARQLVAYLMSLHSDAIVFETPPFPVKGTNAPAGTVTNAPASAPAK